MPPHNASPRSLQFYFSPPPRPFVIHTSKFRPVRSTHSIIIEVGPPLRVRPWPTSLAEFARQPMTRTLLKEKYHGVFHCLVFSFILFVMLQFYTRFFIYIHIFFKDAFSLLPCFTITNTVTWILSCEGLTCRSLQIRNNINTTSSIMYMALVRQVSSHHPRLHRYLML